MCRRVDDNFISACGFVVVFQLQLLHEVSVSYAPLLAFIDTDTGAMVKMIVIYLRPCFVLWNDWWRETYPNK